MCGKIKCKTFLSLHLLLSICALHRSAVKMHLMPGISCPLFLWDHNTMWAMLQRTRQRNSSAGWVNIHGACCFQVRACSYCFLFFLAPPFDSLLGVNSLADMLGILWHHQTVKTNNQPGKSQWAIWMMLASRTILNGRVMWMCPDRQIC